MYRHIKQDHVYPGFRWGDYTDAEVAALSDQDRAIMAHLVDQGIYERSAESDDLGAQYQAATPEEIEESHGDQTAGGGSEVQQRRKAHRA